MSPRLASCSCGQLQVSVQGEPLRVSVCHCLACQRRSGSVFAAQARFALADVELRGQSTRYERVGDSGGRVSFHFCPQCGSTVYYQVEGYDEAQIAVPLGAFADPGFPPPTVSVYEARRHPWVGLPTDIEHLD